MRKEWGTSPEVREMVERYFDKPRIVINTRFRDSLKNQAKENDRHEDKE